MNGELHTTETNSSYNAMINTKRTRQDLTKKCAVKWFAILAMVSSFCSVSVSSCGSTGVHQYRVEEPGSAVERTTKY